MTAAEAVSQQPFSEEVCVRAPSPPAPDLVALARPGRARGSFVSHLLSQQRKWQKQTGVAAVRGAPLSLTDAGSGPSSIASAFHTGGKQSIFAHLVARDLRKLRTRQ